LVRDHPGRPVPEETTSLDFYGAGEDNGGRGTDSTGGRHPNRTNGAPTTPPNVFYRPDALPAAQPTASTSNNSCIVYFLTPQNKNTKKMNLLFDDVGDSEHLDELNFGLVTAASCNSLLQTAC